MAEKASTVEGSQGGSITSVRWQPQHSAHGVHTQCSLLQPRAVVSIALMECKRRGLLQSRAVVSILLMEREQCDMEVMHGSTQS